MARTCTICVHTERTQIDEALVNRSSFADVAKRFSLSGSAVSRHFSRHVRRQPAPRRSKISPATALLVNRLQSLFDATARLLDEHGAADPALALKAIARMEHQCLAQHRLDPAGSASQQTANLTGISNLLQTALDPFPDAKAAVIKLLETAGENQKAA